MKSSFLALTAFAMLVGGCSSGSSGGGNNSNGSLFNPGGDNKAGGGGNVNDFATALQGTWVTGCLQGNNGSAVAGIRISGSNYIEEGQAYTDANCQNPAGQPQEVQGTAAVVGADANVAGAYDVNLTENGQTLYQIIKIQGNQLFIGQSTDNAQTRPTALMNVPFNKK